MNNQAKQRVINFYHKPGVCVSVSRQTISRMLEMGYPTLDLVLHDLVAEGLLERHPIMDDQFRPTRQFSFVNEADKARRLAEAIAERERETQDRVHESIQRRENEAKERARAAIEREQRKKDYALERQAQRDLDRQLARERALNEAEEAKLKLKRKMREQAQQPLVTFASTYVEKSTATSPWDIIRARHYAKPPLLPSKMRVLTQQELMTGRTRRSA